MFSLTAFNRFLARSAWHYHIVSNWRVAGRIEDVADLWLDSGSLSSWWRSVFLEARVLAPGDQHGRGRVVDLHTKGWLPYTLRLRGRVVESKFPHRFTIETWGDLNGRAEWHFEQAGPDVNMVCDWSVNVRKPIVRWLSFLCKPLFASNHRWVMARGQRSFQRELLRRGHGPATAPLLAS